jgi:predicted O-methyltransferase YrrM
MDRILLDELVEASQWPVDSPELEAVLQEQQKRSLASPGVEMRYYWFLYRLARAMLPKVSLELGTHTGISAACLAEGNPKGRIVTVNNQQELAEENRRPNVEYLLQDSLQKIEIREGIDILFLDTWHDGIRCEKEYELYRGDMNPGGIILFDDIYLLDCMNEFWKHFIPKTGKKLELPLHGNAGFGAIIL